ncbi:ATPase/GTPase, AAA15 family [Chitinophaga sp. YR573]|uniref:AAA family ATPase n=1 Tax=Chitinophaga sp. YR573 TaxID=1881040 RepID=UPI0008B0ACB1|nr:ATP-binding protein [Chitinophaga sp. YR573]SEW15736.1 ATPase/GTPase, AAA15 family [Chitinophaga sp. YR573]
MIIDFSIKNFRTIKDKITLSFEPENSENLAHYYIIEPMPGLKLLKLGLIYGSNGSGKSTILKGLEFLRRLVMNPLQQKHDKLDFSPFLFDQQTPKEKSSFELNFVHNNTKYTYQIDFTRDAILYEKLEFYSPKKSLVYERNTDVEKQLSIIKFGGKIKVKKVAESTLEANTLWNTTVLSGFLKTNIDSGELRNVTDWFHSVLTPIITPTSDISEYITSELESQKINKKNILQFLRKADFKISDISFEKHTNQVDKNIREVMLFFSKQQQIDLDPKKLEELDNVELTELFFQHSVKNGDNISKYTLPFREESEGTKRYFEFSGLLDIILNEQSVLAIDELESSLHPDLLKHFLLLFLVNVKTTQLIATTHYRELLLERDILRDDVIWFTEKKENGSVDLYSLSDFDSTIVRDTTSIFNAYRSGKLGAVPDLSDYYIDLTDGKK